MTVKDIARIISYSIGLRTIYRNINYLEYRQTTAFTMERLAYNMILEGQYYG